MTIAEILAEINEKYPNAADNASKIRKMNILQKRLFRIMKKQTFVDYEILANQPSYPLAMNIDDVFEVLVDGIKYPFKMIKDTSTYLNKYYSFIGTDTGDWISIYPEPLTSGVTLTIWFYEVPTEITEFGPPPQLDEDYHMMFVYFVCKELAESYRDFDISNGFAAQYNQYESEFKRVFQKPEVVTIHSESGW